MRTLLQEEIAEREIISEHTPSPAFSCLQSFHQNLSLAIGPCIVCEGEEGSGTNRILKFVQVCRLWNFPHFMRHAAQNQQNLKCCVYLATHYWLDVRCWCSACSASWFGAEKFPPSWPTVSNCTSAVCESCGDEERVSGDRGLKYPGRQRSFVAKCGCHASHECFVGDWVEVGAQHRLLFPSLGDPSIQPIAGTRCCRTCQCPLRLSMHQHRGNDGRGRQSRHGQCVGSVAHFSHRPTGVVILFLVRLCRSFLPGIRSQRSWRGTASSPAPRNGPCHRLAASRRRHAVRRRSGDETGKRNIQRERECSRLASSGWTRNGKTAMPMRLCDARLAHKALQGCRKAFLDRLDRSAAPLRRFASFRTFYARHPEAVCKDHHLFDRI